MGPAAVTYISRLIKIGSGIQKLIGGNTDRQQGDLISVLLFFKIRKVG
jgi:hypothetical protein